MTTLKPLGDRVIIKRTKVSTTKGGILIPESAQEKPKEGVVVAVGPGIFNDDGQKEEMSVCVGDTVLFGSYAGTEVTNSDDEEVVIMRESEILGIVGAKK